MSERKRQIICTTIAFLVWSVTMYTLGEQRMKRWEDAWYQSHPVVKATYVPVHNDLASEECALLGGKWRNVADPTNAGNEWLCILAPAPPKKAKPAKANCEVAYYNGYRDAMNKATKMVREKFSLPQGDIDPQGAVCVAGSSDGHPIEIPCPQITWPAAKP